MAAMLAAFLVGDRLALLVGLGVEDLDPGLVVRRGLGTGEPDLLGELLQRPGEEVAGPVAERAEESAT